jgi:nucleoside 2-deoxyribosyltransferase
LFSLAEKRFNRHFAAALQNVFTDLEVILPQDRAQQLISKPNAFALIFEDCIEMVQQCDAVVAILDGADSDSGTCVELGYAYALRKPIVGVRTDFRGSEDRGLNLMVSHVCSVLIVETAMDVDAIATEVCAALRRKE